MSEADRCRQPLIHELTRHAILAYPIETGSTRRGVSDIFVNLKGRVVWFECKEVETEDYMKLHIPFEPLQYKFLYDNYAEGGISVSVIRTPTRFIFVHVSNITRLTKSNDSHYYQIRENRHILSLVRLDVPVLLEWLSSFNT
jgi:hypothetical protein